MYVVCSVAQLCLTLHEPMDSSLPGSSVREISQQEYWSGLPCPSPGELPNPGIEPLSPSSPALQEDSLPLSHRVIQCKCPINNYKQM